LTQELGIEGVRVGHYTDRAGGTGCTVILCPHGAMGAVEVRGQAPGTRETDILSPLSSVAEVHGVVLCGGSANGLAAASGVARYLEERGYGVRTPYGRVPLVSAAVIFDLPVGNPTARPSAEDAYAAAVGAGSTVEEGSVGAGTGATVGKLFREDSWMKGGIGLSKMSLPGGVIVAALSVVNAFGDVLAEDGSVLAGALLDGEFVNSHEYVLRLTEHPHFGRMEQTTLRSNAPPSPVWPTTVWPGPSRPCTLPWTAIPCSCSRWVIASATCSRPESPPRMWWQRVSAAACAWRRVWMG